MGLSDYAAVAATVEATRALRKPAFAGVVNAVLRRWLRERETRRAQLDCDAVTRTAHPRWLIEKFDADWPDQTEAILATNNAPAPLWLRVNRRRIARADFAAQLAEQGVDIAFALAQRPLQQRSQRRVEAQPPARALVQQARQQCAVARIVQLCGQCSECRTQRLSVDDAGQRLCRQRARVGATCAHARFNSGRAFR
jgi:16S rRNA C967 or C1407 C5-methylase (RsmB/RsmF family)